jgi:7-cyano-7-deazaguanine reductase|tara:strand:- start:4431 stop:5228 length:798 start_codon:yes stop_codon:yes gene_type:complete
MNELPLGKPTDYPTAYNPNILVPINRTDSRRRLGMELSSQEVFGIDSWTSYELSWLDSNSVPRNGILYLSYNAFSKNFVESKSLKLYLNSINNHIFSNEEHLSEVLKKDVEACVNSEVQIEIKKTPKEFFVSANSIDDCPIERVSEEVNSLVLKTEKFDSDEQLSCSLFRSLCPVTAQPDWATITIAYKGKNIIQSTLLSYLLSFRNHQGFHEECVERIFTDLAKRCKPERLTVQANFLRRGGIEINPIRSSVNNFDVILRDARQ